jgi:pyruvate dehydrogenase E1 component alpha subunit
VGLAWAARYRETDRVALVFMGDGATSQGDFHEGLNFAAVFQSPVIFVCQNNHWAISMPRSKQTRSETIAQKALAYGMPGLQIDGNDILASYAAVQEAIGRARAGDGPTLIECVTYRMTMHTTADDPRRYRTEQEVELWKARDPITRFQKYLIKKDLLAEDKIEEVEHAVLDEIQSAIDSAEERAKTLGDPTDIFLHHYDELPPYLQEQREELVREIDAKAKEAHNG